MSVHLIDHMGSDATVARSAWVSTQRDEREATPEAVEKLIRFLLSNRPCHASPFGHPQLTVLVEAPIFVAREWMRHRVQTYSEVSSRYSEMREDFYVPKHEDVRTQVGRPGDYHFESVSEPLAAVTRLRMERSYIDSFSAYQRILDSGVAREVARTVLPLGTMTRFYATASLRNWLGFLVLRNHPAALLEIRREAEELEALLHDLYPTTMRVWTDEGRPTL